MSQHFLKACLIHVLLKLAEFKLRSVITSSRVRYNVSGMLERSINT